MTQGERIKCIRKTLNLTMEKFGEKLGVGKTAISRIEKGINNLTEQMALSICREYNVNYDYLIYGEGDMFNELPQTLLDKFCVQHGLNDFDKTLIQKYVSLPEDQRLHIKEFVEHLTP